MSTQDTTKTNPKAIKPCPRCGSAAGKGNGGSQCLCKKGKKNAVTDAGAGKPEPCDAPIKKAPSTVTTGGCGCGGTK